MSRIHVAFAPGVDGMQVVLNSFDILEGSVVKGAALLIYTGWP